MSVDGFIAGPNQSEENPLGEGGMARHEWLFSLEAWRRSHGLEGGDVNASTPIAHHQREPLELEGGTTFHFVVDDSGARTFQQYFAAALVDVVQLSVVPLLLGDGARLFENLGETPPKLEQVQAIEAPGITHLRYRVVR